MLLSHRHDRGRVSITAEVDPSTQLDKRSLIGSGSQVWKSVIVGSNVTGKIRDSFIGDSLVYDTEVVRSQIHGSVTEGGQIFGSTLIMSEVGGEATIQGAELFRSTAVGRAVVQGDVKLYNVILHSQMRVGEGEWTRAPRYHHIDNEYVNLGVTESIEGRAYVSCQLKPMSVWVKGKDRFARVMGWPTSVTDEIAEVLTKWLDEPLSTY